MGGKVSDVSFGEYWGLGFFVFLGSFFSGDTFQVEQLFLVDVFQVLLAHVLFERFIVVSVEFHFSSE